MIPACTLPAPSTPGRRGLGAEYVTQTQTPAPCSSVRTSPDCALLTLVISSPPWCGWWLFLPPDTCAWAIMEPSSPWCLMAAPSPMVGLWAEVLAGDGAESLRVRYEVILGRQDSLAVGSVPVPPSPTSSQASVTFSENCSGYKVSSVVNALIGFNSNLLSMVT